MVEKANEGKKKKKHQAPSSSEKARRVANRRRPRERPCGESTTRRESEDDSLIQGDIRDAELERIITNTDNNHDAEDAVPTAQTLGYEDTPPPRRSDCYSGPLFRDQDSRLEKLVTSTHRRRKNSENSSGLDSWAGLTLDESVQSIEDVFKPELVDVALYEALLDVVGAAGKNKSNNSVTDRTAELSDHQSLGYNSCSIADESLYLEDVALNNDDDEESKVEIQAPSPIEL